MRLLFFGLFIFLTTFSGVHAQIKLLAGADEEIRNRVELNYLPTSGTFITVQIAALINSANYITSETKAISSFTLIKPAFVRLDGKSAYLSLGIFKDYEAAKTFAAKIQCIYKGSYGNNIPFPVAYSDGKRIPLDEFAAGNLEEKIPDLRSAKKKLKKMLKEVYYRIHIGYYEKPSFTPEEQKVFEILAANDIALFQEPFEKGIRYIVDEKFKSFEKAVTLERQIETLIGRYVGVRSYYTYRGIGLSDMKDFCGCFKDEE